MIRYSFTTHNMLLYLYHFKEVYMNAQELTEYYFKCKYIVDDLAKRVEYLEQENAKLRRMVEDMQIDIKLMQNMRGPR